jgi:hypothetical protein
MMFYFFCAPNFAQETTEGISTNKHFSYLVQNLGTPAQAQFIEDKFLSKVGVISCDANPNTHIVTIVTVETLDDPLILDMLKFLNLEIITPNEINKFYN